MKTVFCFNRLLCLLVIWIMCAARGLPVAAQDDEATVNSQVAGDTHNSDTITGNNSATASRLDNMPEGRGIIVVTAS